MTRIPNVSRDGLEIHSFETAADLDRWLSDQHETSRGIWVRLFKVKTGRRGPSFADVLELTLAYGWSESQRRGYDDQSFLQRISPRRTSGTTSARNRQIAQRLTAQGRLTAAGRTALDLPETQATAAPPIPAEGLSET